MQSPRIIRLRETDAAFRASAPVIDADFAIVRERPTWFGRLKLALLMAGCAALAGLLVPPIVAAALTIAKEF